MTPSDEQSGIEFLLKSKWEKTITAVDTTADTVTFTDPDHALGGRLSDGDSVDISGSSANDGTYTIATDGIDTDTTGETTLTFDDSIDDSTADGDVVVEDPIGASTSGTRTRSIDTEDVTNKDSGRWQENIALTQEVTYDFESFFMEGTSYQSGLGIKIEVADGEDGFNELEGIESSTLSLAMDLISYSNNDSSRWREVKPNTRSVELSIDRDYIDPESDTAANDLLTAADNGNTINVKVTLGTFSLDMDWHVTEEAGEKPFDDLATSPLTLMGSDTSPTFSHADQDDGLRNLLAAFLAEPPQYLSAKAFEVVDAKGNTVSGATTYEMSCLPESIDIELPVEGAASVSGSLANHGSETRTTQS